jgi:SOS-response transcriptional repressor LexA
MELILGDIVRRVDAILTTQGRSRAEVCRSLQISNSTFTEWAKGTVPTIEKFIKVAENLEVSVSYLLFGEFDASLPKAQQDLLERYELLDERGKRIAQMFLDTLVREKETENQKKLYEQKKDEKPLEVKDPEPIYGQFYLHEFEGEDMIILPILEKTAAGMPTDAQETIQIPRRLLKGDETDFFCLQVKGYSMTEAGIDDGDHVILRRTNVPENEKIMLIQHEGKTTLKKLRITNGITYLCWEDGSNHEPIVVNSDGFIVQGSLVHIIKTP